MVKIAISYYNIIYLEKNSWDKFHPSEKGAKEVNFWLSIVVIEFSSNQPLAFEQEQVQKMVQVQ